MPTRRATKPFEAFALALAGLMIALATLSIAQVSRSTLGRLTARPITYFIAPGAPGSGFRPGDERLAEWALADWARASAGRIRFEAAPQPKALIRLHWTPAGDGRYGEMRPMLVDGQRGAMLFIRPDTSGLGPEVARRTAGDPLFRDTVVYLTCLHEIGHALGLPHTDEYADIMYFFGFGGDIPGFFGRYRQRLRSRDDIAATSGLSDTDIRHLLELYAP